MKTKEIYLLVAASTMVVVGWSAWRFAGIPSVVDPPANTSLPAQQTTPVPQEATPGSSHRTGRPIVSEVIETREMKMARLQAEIKRLQASSAPLKDVLKIADPKARTNALKDLSKPKDMAFLKSLGLSDELSDKVYQMLRAKGDLQWDHVEARSEAWRKGETYTADGSELRQMHADLEAAVGKENYDKIKYWEATLLERGRTGIFQQYLQSRSLPLTEQQEATVVDAMYQAREGKASFYLTSSSISMEDKLAYIDKVKQSLTPVLNANAVALLGQHLKETAEMDLRRQSMNEDIQKRITDVLNTTKDESLRKRLTDFQKTIEDKKLKQASPPAPPR